MYAYELLIASKVLNFPKLYLFLLTFKYQIKRFWAQ